MTGNGFHPPITLRGRYLELVPLVREHAARLAEAGRDPEVWQFLRIGPGHPPTTAEMEAFIDQLLGYQAAGDVLPLTMALLPERTPVGIIRYLDIDRPNRMVEIGTWLDSRYWRSPLNTEAKLLTLGYAFEEEKVHRLQLKTDSRNVRSQTAIERLGGVPEGALREAHLVRNGYFRTSLYYSILESEWPAVKARLEEKLSKPWAGLPAP
ncbi:MAG: GNAT family protein [Thermoplasmata archaeon]|jgi:RimJ/RimL family protein N-acetyltransferase